MKLYHGTDGRFISHILKVGLKPRGKAGRNNWKHVKHQSNPLCVYLTDSYAPYFAFNAAKGKDPICAVVEVDSDRLKANCLFPDEDCLEQLGRRIKDGVEGDLSKRTLHYRKLMFNDHGFRHNHNLQLFDWQDSLKALGTCAHRGVISPSAITRVVSWPMKENIRLHLTWDPTITLANQRILGDRYRHMMAQLFGDNPPEVTDDPGMMFWNLPPIKNLEMHHAV